ncbi:MAG: hypothetical protein HZB55_18625 [Deltaproteobacteria bacterium]|nr:hypothetical protein [Deltaproteobacteria bacterium]
MKNGETVAVVVLVALGLAGCGAIHRSYAKPEAYRGVRTIRLVDETSPILLRASNAAQVAEAFRMDFEGKGYTVCSTPDCRADAVGTVRATRYEQRELNTVRQTVYSLVAFRLDLRRSDGQVLLAVEPYSEDTLALDFVAGRLVQDTMDYYVPKCSP